MEAGQDAGHEEGKVVSEAAPSGAWAVAGAQSTVGTPLPPTGWWAYFWGPPSWPSGTGIQKHSLV